MGKSMARNVMKKGYELNIYARTRSKVSDLEQEGAVFYETIPACVKDADAVITIVGYPKDVEEVYFGENGILQNAKQGTYVIDMTTSSPKIAEKIDREAKERGLHALDAPVTGGDTGAKAGIFPYWWEERRKITSPVCRCLKQWETISIMKERQEQDKIQNLRTRIMIAGTYPDSAKR